jgi:hypothetical protein
LREKFFFQVLATLDTCNFFGNYQINYFFVFSVLLVRFRKYLLKNYRKNFFGEFLEPPKKGKIAIFVIFGHF